VPTGVATIRATWETETPVEVSDRVFGPQIDSPTMATEHANDGAAERRSVLRSGPVPLLVYGVAFGVGSLVFLAGAKNAVALYTGTVPQAVFDPGSYFLVAAFFTCVGSVLLLYGLYGTVRAAIRSARD
jgi:hypothetical protein